MGHRKRMRLWAAIAGVLLAAGVVGAYPGRGDALPRIITVKDERLPDGTGRTVTMIAHMKAPAEDIFAVISDYGHYADLIPDITQVKILSQDEGSVVARFRYFVLIWGEFEITREFVHHGADAIEFKTLDAGDLGEMWGSWRFLPEAETQDTKVTYTASIRPKFSAPDFLVKYVLKSEAPKVMEAALEAVLAKTGAHRDPEPASQPTASAVPAAASAAARES